MTQEASSLRTALAKSADTEKSLAKQTALVKSLEEKVALMEEMKKDCQRFEAQVATLQAELASVSIRKSLICRMTRCHVGFWFVLPRTNGIGAAQVSTGQQQPCPPYHSEPRPAITHRAARFRLRTRLLRLYTRLP